MIAVVNDLYHMQGAAGIIVLIFWIGLFPKPFLDRIEPTTQVLLQRLAKAGATHWLAETPSDHAVAAAHVPPASGE